MNLKSLNNDDSSDDNYYKWRWYYFVYIILFIVIAFILIYAQIHWFKVKIEPGWLKHLWQLYKDFFRSIGNNILVIIGFVLVVAFIISIQALFSKWRKIRVFISYQHMHQDIVSQLRDKIKSKWLNVYFIPFEPADHDKMIVMIEKQIRKSDILLVLPGTHRSFVDAEILSAYSHRKILVFLQISDDQTTPDTALKGYPVFDCRKLEGHNFIPLLNFIYYTNRLWKDTFKNFLRVSSGFGEYIFVVLFIYFIIGSVIGGIIHIIAGIIMGFTMELEFLMYRYYYWGATVLLCGIFGYNYFKATYQRLKAIRISRQKIITGEHTFEYIEKGLRYLDEDRQILDALNKGSLNLRHD